MIAAFKAHVSKPITFAECEALCKAGKDSSKGGKFFKLANNSYIQPSTVAYGITGHPDAYGIKLHQTEVLTVYRDGRYRLGTGGHHSNTTCDRLNRLSPVPCRIKDGVIVAEGVGPLFQALVIRRGDDGWEEDQCPECRLKYLRGEIRKESISWGEIAELQNLAKYIEPGDVELLELAGVPEFPE